MTIDLSDQNYSFPSSVVQTMLWPNIVLWHPNSRQMKLLELTACFKETFVSSNHPNSPSTVSLFQHVRKSTQIEILLQEIHACCVPLPYTEKVKISTVKIL